jgi:hypothetical protein
MDSTMGWSAKEDICMARWINALFVIVGTLNDHEDFVFNFHLKFLQISIAQ